MAEIDSFLKLFEFDDDYRNNLSEVIVEIVDNALKHSKGDCILCINVLKSEKYKYQYADVATVTIDDIFVGKEIIEYINKKDKSEYSNKNKVVMEAYNNQKEFFNESYGIEAFAMVSAFQKYVTTRKLSGNTGGTGLTTLIKALEEKSNDTYCYTTSGKTNIYFKKDFIKLDKYGLVGFNKENNYIEKIPDKEIVRVNNYDMNVNAYNLQFILQDDVKK